jgi:D-3-phosphoglycerate dehydrogenase
MSERFTVLVTDKVSGGGLDPIRGDDRFDIVQVDDSNDPAFAEALPTAHGLIVRSATKVRADMLSKATALRVVGRAGVGVDNIDLEAATARGVAVLNAPAGNTVSAAELTMALILSMVRGVAAADASMRSGEWARSRFKGAELRGRTLGLIGAGRIGGEVARRCRAFGMQVVAYDPYLTDERASDLGVERKAEVDDVLAVADVLSLHVPLTDATRAMIDEPASRIPRARSATGSNTTSAVGPARRVRPASITTIRSASIRASFMSCVTSTTGRFRCDLSAATSW